MNKKTIHIISQAHLDLAWLWSWRESYAEALNNLNTVTRLMETYPDLTFSYSNAIIYKWVMNAAPRLFDKIRKFVAEGRWEVVGGWLVEADCNLCSGESLIRQALYGKAFLRDHFGVDVRIGYCPDAFGHTGSLPTILTATGYDYYVFSKPRYDETFPHLFRWREGPENEITAWRIHGGYATGPASSADNLEESLRHAADDFFPSGCSHTAFFLGLGDHGGGPSEEQIKRVIKLSSDDSLPDIKFSTLEALFAGLKDEGAIDESPVLEQPLRHHNIGCYSACGQVKHLNRTSETSLHNAEIIASVASLFHEYAYPVKELADSWENVLFNQFHDILAGTCVMECYEDTSESLGMSMFNAKKLATERLLRIAQDVDTSTVEHNVLFVFNPLPWSRKESVCLDMFTAIDGANGPRIASIRDLETNDLSPVQFTHAASPYGPWLEEWKKLMVTVDLPPCGYKLFELRTEDVKRNEAPSQQIRYDVDPTYLGINSLRFHENTECLGGTLGLIVCDDDSDTFGHERTSFLENPENVRVTKRFSLEEGPIRRGIRLRGEYHKSELEMDLYTWTDLDRIDLILSGEWREKRTVLKLEIPTALKRPRITRQEAYTHEDLVGDGRENPGHAWCAVSGLIEERPYTLVVMNSGIYSLDAVGNTIHLTLRRSVLSVHYGDFRYGDETGGKYLDQGRFSERIRLVLLPGEFDPAMITRLTMEFQHPPTILMDTRHSGSYPTTRSFLSLESESSVITAWKQTEDGEGFIIRLWESGMKRETATIISAPLSIKEKIDMAPGQIKTLRFQATEGVWRCTEVSALE